MNLEVLPEPAIFVSSEEYASADSTAGWVPSEDQSVALAVLMDSMRDPGVSQLTGAAGAGKTSLMRALLRRLTPAWEVLLLAPTWRAANRLRQVVGMSTQSVHGAIYGKPVNMRACPAPECQEWSRGLMTPEQGEQFVEHQIEGQTVRIPQPVYHYVCEHCGHILTDATRLPQKLCFVPRDALVGDTRPYRLVVIDEASMMRFDMVRDAEQFFLSDGRTRLLYVGDPNQLPPVQSDEEARQHPDPASLLTPTAALHRIHRQAAGNPILALAHNLKTVPEVLCGGANDWPFPRWSVDARLAISSRVALDAPAQWAAEHRCAGRDVALIAMSNLTRARLNLLVRTYTSARYFAQQAAAHIIPGDRLLMRSNSGSVFNGEVWTVCTWTQIPPKTCLLDEESRAVRKNSHYEHDHVLGRWPIGVFRADLALVEEPSIRTTCLFVVPLDDAGLPMLESDLVIQGLRADDARQACRSITSSWCAEYRRLFDSPERESEWTGKRMQYLTRQTAIAKFVRACAMGVGKAAESAINDMHKNSSAPERDALRKWLLDTPGAWLGNTDADLLKQWLTGFDSVYDVAARVETVEDYLVAVYGALRPDTVATADFGEALTCHAMQGSQAQYVGLVCDGAFWGAWRHDRVDALKWIYTAVTRSTDRLAIFSIRKQT